LNDDGCRTLSEWTTLPQHLRRYRKDLRSFLDAWFHAAADLNKEQGHGVHDGTTAPKVIKGGFKII
jgi:hypothetical protein